MNKAVQTTMNLSTQRDKAERVRQYARAEGISLVECIAILTPKGDYQPKVDAANAAVKDMIDNERATRQAIMQEYGMSPDK